MKNQFKERFERAKKEIEEDIKNGDVPNDIKSFSELDLFVDANYYGGLCDEDYQISENYEFENKLQNTINEWLETR